MRRQSRTEVRELPPAWLRSRTTGREDADWYRSSGRAAVEALVEHLTEIKRSSSDFARVYEFGCGCGRVTVPLTDIVPLAKVTATDTDIKAIEWLRVRLPEARVETNGELPPLRFPNDSFDLIVVFGVFGHIPDDQKSAWLAEFARVCAPGGVVFMTPS